MSTCGMAYLAAAAVAALFAGSTMAEEARFKALADAPMAEGRPTLETAKLLKVHSISRL